MRDVLSALPELLAAVSLRESFLMRAIISLVFTVITTVWFYVNIEIFVRWLKKEIESDEMREFLINKLRHWKYLCYVLGYLLMTGNGPGEGLAYTLPMALYGTDVEIYYYFVELLAAPLAAATVFRIVWWLKTIRLSAIPLVLSHHARYIGVGMLIGQGVELIARVVSMFNPTSGSLLYFVFYGIILLQIAFLGYCGLHFVVSFVLSFLTREMQNELLWEIQEARRRKSRNGNGGSSSGGGGGAASSSDAKSGFPEYLYGESGDTYRLQNDSGDHATYYCPKTGHTKTVWKDSLET